MKPNSWTYNIIEVSWHNLESSQTWGLCMDFLNHREGGIIFYQVFLLSPLQSNWTVRVCKRLLDFNPLPHGGRTYWPITFLYANFSKSAEGKVSSKIRYSSSWILGLFWNQDGTYLGPNLPIINFLVNHSKIRGHRWPSPWYYSLWINPYNIENSLTAKAFLAQQIWRGNRESTHCRREEVRVT